MPFRLSRRSFLAGAGAVPLTQSAQPGLESALRLWYRQPAPDWNEALPIGNGRMGAMVFGGAIVERLQLNEDTLVSDEPGRQDMPIDINKDFDEVMALLRGGKFREAEAIMN